MRKSLSVILLFFSLIFLNCFANVLAESSGIGVSPSQISINGIKPGSSIQREIVISRGNLSEDEAFVFSTDNSTTASWLNFQNGTELVIPKGENSAKKMLLINIPQNIELKKYVVKLFVLQKSALPQNGVNIQTGVGINFEIFVSNVDLVKMRVLSARIDDLKLGEKINLKLNIENQGNVTATPDRVSLTIKNTSGKVVSTLESQNLIAINPFTTSEQVISFDNSNLVVGEYLTHLIVYGASNEILYEYDLFFRVTENISDKVAQVVSRNVMVYEYCGYGLILLGIFLIILGFTKMVKRQYKRAAVQ